MKIGILGANGQVGAELCLKLRLEANVEIVPICRSRTGSAFLRYKGLSCRHGDIANAEQAEGLVGDCDLIVNLALPNLAIDYRNARRIHDTVIQHSIKFSPKHATVIYFSTMSVYGDRHVNQRFIINSLYGKEKLRGERIAQRTARRDGRRLFIFRLGHVMGELQNITSKVRDLIREGIVILPVPERWSNTVQIATIVDAIKTAASSENTARPYDLFNVPQWSWQQVFEFEAQRAGLFLDVRAAPRNKQSVVQRTKSFLSFSLRQTLISANTRKVGARAAAWLSSYQMKRLKAIRAIAAARSEVNTLNPKVIFWDALEREPISGNCLPGLHETASLLSSHDSLGSDSDIEQWPEDYPLAHVR